MGIAFNPETADGKPPLAGFVLGKLAATTSGGNNDVPMRWTGPILPSGYVSKRHVFQNDNDGNGSAVIDFVCGLGLNLQRSRLKQQQRREETPKVLPPIFNQQKMLCPTNTAISQKMLARDGTELNFHAVRLMTDDVRESTPAPP